MEEKESMNLEQNAVVTPEVEKDVNSEISKETGKNKRLKIIISSVIVVVLVALTVFFCTRGSRDIVGVWESDVFIIKGVKVQEILVINDSGEGAAITIDLNTGSAYDIDTGRFDIKAFSCNFYDDSDKRKSPVGSGTKWTDYYEGDTVFNYNPITNHITSGERVYSKTDKYQSLLNLV